MNVKLLVFNPNFSQIVTRAGVNTKRSLKKVPKHWDKMVPDFSVIIVDRPLNKLPILAKYASQIEDQYRQNTSNGSSSNFWQNILSITTLPPFSPERSLFISPSVEHGSPKEIRELLLEKIAQFLWETRPLLRQKAEECLDGVVLEIGESFSALFASAFSHFFSHPELLRSKNPAAYLWLQRLDDYFKTP